MPKPYLGSNKLEWVGKRFGRLVITQELPYRDVVVKCDCGDYGLVRDRFNIQRGFTKSCGCLKYTSGGKSRTSEYRSWESMLRRVDGKIHRRYYIDRGIGVCAEWRNFHNFLADMGPKPTPQHTLDRIDNDKGYSPMNCRWATKTEQARNRRPAYITNAKEIPWVK